MWKIEEYYWLQVFTEDWLCTLKSTIWWKGIERQTGPYFMNIYVEGHVLFCFRSKSKYLRNIQMNKEDTHIFFFKNFLLDSSCFIMCDSFRCTAEWFSYTHTCIYSVFRFFFNIGHYRVLSTVSCATQQVLFYIQ